MRIRLIILALLIGWYLPQQAQAKSEYLEVMTTTYATAAKTIEDRSCAYCHVSDSDYGLNPYGKQIAHELVAANTKELTSAILQKVDPQDADQDGTTNADEIKAGTNPADPKSGAKLGATPPAPTAATAEPAPAQKPKSWFPKNAYHPAIVHFPIALFIAGLLLDFLGMRHKNPTLLTAGWYNLVLGSISTIGSIISGVVAMQQKRYPFSGNMKDHLVMAVMGSVIMWIMVGMRVHRHEKMNVPMRMVYYVLAVATLLLISWSAHLGGVMVYGE